MTRQVNAQLNQRLLAVSNEWGGGSACYHPEPSRESLFHRSGDERMLETLEVVRTSGFEPARLGDQAVAVHFLYLSTTKEVGSKRNI